MHRLVPKPEDYIRSKAGSAAGICYVIITAYEEHSEDPRRSITIGCHFLQKHYSIFDADERMVSLIEI